MNPNQLFTTILVSAVNTRLRPNSLSVVADEIEKCGLIGMNAEEKVTVNVSSYVTHIPHLHTPTLPSRAKQWRAGYPVCPEGN
jgi:hypothetical protein